MTKKYEFVENDTKTLVDGTVLYRIRAVRDILKINLKTGDLGGYIEKEGNLPHDDLSWVDSHSYVAGGYSTLRNSTVYFSSVLDSALDISTVRDSEVKCSTLRNGTVRSSVIEDSNVLERSVVECSKLRYSMVQDSYVKHSVVQESLVRNSVIDREKIVDGEILCDEQHIFFKNVGSQNRQLMAYRAATGVWSATGVKVIRGCFSGTLEEFESAVNEKHGDNQYGQEYRLLIAFIKLRASTWKKEG